MKYATSLEIARPRDEVLPLIADLAQTPKWLCGLVLHETVQGAYGQVGTTSRVVFQTGKQRMEALKPSCAYRGYVDAARGVVCAGCGGRYR